MDYQAALTCGDRRRRHAQCRRDRPYRRVSPAPTSTPARRSRAARPLRDRGRRRWRGPPRRRDRRRAARARVRLDRDGRAACTTRRPRCIEAHGPEDVRRGDRRRQAPHDARVLRGRARAATSGRRSARRPRDGDERRASTRRRAGSPRPGEADSYVWSSRPSRPTGAMTLWLVPPTRPGVSVAGAFDGLGLRGNDSAPVTAEGVAIAARRPARRRRRRLRHRDGDRPAVVRSARAPRSASG